LLIHWQSFANGAFNETLQELGIQKPKLNCLVIIEAEVNKASASMRIWTLTTIDLREY
jgi:hypothetical protein